MLRDIAWLVTLPLAVYLSAVSRCDTPPSYALIERPIRDATIAMYEYPTWGRVLLVISRTAITLDPTQRLMTIHTTDGEITLPEDGTLLVDESGVVTLLEDPPPAAFYAALLGAPPAREDTLRAWSESHQGLQQSLGRRPELLQFLVGQP